MKKSAYIQSKEENTAEKHSDLTFITNQEEKNLLDRFNVLIKDAITFDALVGYFYTSGFYKLYPTLEKTEKIKILVGLNTDLMTLQLMQNDNPNIHSHTESLEIFSETLVKELESSEDNQSVEKGIRTFIEWIASGKLELRAYPKDNLHAKVYIITFRQGDRDVGRVITGSSNFTFSGLVNNLEFNVELKNYSDYQFAKAQFDSLWDESVPLEEIYKETIETKTWLNETITPYQLYLKFLYEYFYEELNIEEEILFKYRPPNFKCLEYQEQAVLNAKRILDEYGGVFLSDVVGLGKTYMAAMLASQLKGQILVIAPPILLESSNQGSWVNVFSDFRIPAVFQSLGKLDELLQRGTDKYKNIIIDEAHRFRTESNTTYEKLAQICRGKLIILVTATPLNNTPLDILSQIKLFQNSKYSTIPNVPDLDTFFHDMERVLKKLDRKKDKIKYLQTVKDNAQEIRNSVLKHIMIRRTRKEIEIYFSEDLRKQNLKFPEVAPPEPIFYQLNEIESHVFDKTVELITQHFKYSRYKSMHYHNVGRNLEEEQSQENLSKFMKILLVKRLESSFYAFNRTVDRFIINYQRFLKEFNSGYVYISEKHSYQIYELLEKDDESIIKELLESAKAKKYSSGEFTNSFKEDLESDLLILQKIKELWGKIERDPKLLVFVDLLLNHPILNTNKLIVFTESKETANYLGENLDKFLSHKTLVFTGDSCNYKRQEVNENFDAKAFHPKDDYRILITTEVLAEGVNLHRANIVINYDIPWNPTRLTQRVGRINRVDTPFDKIYTYNFFPTEQSNDLIKLKEAAEAKIQSFITLLGADAHLLTEDENLESHELFSQLMSKDTLMGIEEEESELKYYNVIREIRESNPKLFEFIKKLPKKARSAKESFNPTSQLLTYFRKGKLNKFFLTDNEQASELDFLNAAKLLETDHNVNSLNLSSIFFKLLDQNKNAFLSDTTFTMPLHASRDSTNKLLKLIKVLFKDSDKLTKEQIKIIYRIENRLSAGAIPKQTVKTTYKELKKYLELDQDDLLSIFQILTKFIPDQFLKNHTIENNDSNAAHPKEVILSLFLKNGENNE